MTFTPPATAARQSPATSARQAWKIETIEEEQAVSTVMDGPLKPKTYDTRPLMKARRVPRDNQRLFHNK